MSVDKQLLATLLGKQVDDADDGIGEMPKPLSIVSGSGVPKRKRGKHLQKPEGPIPIELEIGNYIFFCLKSF